MCPQIFTSACTSINKNKLPVLFSNLEGLIGKAEKPDHYIFDIGCGKYTTHIAKKVESLGWGYIGYDPYNQTKGEQELALLAARIYPVSFSTMSNVVNVIDDDQEVIDKIKFGIDIAISHVIFVTIYEGDGTGIGRKTGHDQYQRNMKRKDYLPLFESANLYHLNIPNGFALSDVPFKK